MVQVDKRKQRVRADLIRRWIASEAIRDYLHKALNLPVEEDLPRKHKSLLVECDQVDKE